MTRLKASLLALAVLSHLSLTAQAPAPNIQEVQKHLAEPHYQAGFPALFQGGFKYWDKGQLITWGWNMTLEVTQNKPAVVLYDSSGHAREAYVWLQGAKSVNVDGAAVTKSGKLIVTGGTESLKGVGIGDLSAITFYLAEIGENGHVKREIRTSPYMPVHICAAEDGTVWTFGIDRDENGNGVDSSPMVRQFSFDKGQLKAFLFTKDLDPGWFFLDGRYPGEVTLRCNTKGLVIYNGQSSELVRVDLFDDAVTVTKVAPLPPISQLRITGFALTESGDIFASFHERKNPPMSGLFKLSFNGDGGASWTPVAGTLGPYRRGSPIERLMGAEGDDLVHTRDVDGKMYWSKHGK
jgi:hypothetical protein